MRPGSISLAVVGLVILGRFAMQAAAADASNTSGITEPFRDVMLSSSVPGIVSAWNFKEGEFVKEDQVIIELDKDLEALEVSRRQLVMENRKTDLISLQTLFTNGNISVRKEELLKAETEYKVAVVEHEIASEQLRRRSIKAPCAGVIAEILRDPGEACQQYQPLIRLVDTRQCYFVSSVEAANANKLKVGQSIRLQIEAGTAPVDLEGKIIFLSPVVDPSSGLRKVRVLFNNAGGRIQPGVAGKMVLPN